MTLAELWEVIDFSFDLGDYGYDETFYADIINTKIASQIEVKRVDTQYVICDFSKFIRNNRELISDVIENVYYPEFWKVYKDVLQDEKLNGELWCNIIRDTMQYLLELEENN